MENKLALLCLQKVLKIILTARQNIKISAITDYTETFCNCNYVSTDTKQTTTPNAVEKVNINKKLPAFVWTNLFLICVENKLTPLYRQKVLKLF